MASIFITGSSDGLGLLAGRLLLNQGHFIVLHARNAERRKETIAKCPGAKAVLTGDLSEVEEIIQLARDANAIGRFDAVIHNAGIYRGDGRQLFQVNTLAPYILTCNIHKPQRLIYLSSDMHMHGRAEFDRIDRTTYSDTKLYMLMLAKAVARLWPEVYANAVNPGWVPTRMGGRGAPDNLEAGCRTQAWLAVSDDREAKTSGEYFYHGIPERYNPIADDRELQEKLFQICEKMSGVEFK